MMLGRDGEERNSAPASATFREPHRQAEERMMKAMIPPRFLMKRFCRRIPSARRSSGSDGGGRVSSLPGMDPIEGDPGCSDHQPIRPRRRAVARWGRTRRMPPSRRIAASATGGTGDYSKKKCAPRNSAIARPFLRSGVTVGDVRGQICSVIPWGWTLHLRAPISVSTRPGFFAGRRICGWRTVRFDSHDVRPDSAKTRRGRGAVVYLQAQGDECSGCWRAWNCRFVQRPEGLRRGPCVRGG